MMRVRKLTLTGVATLGALAGALLLWGAPAMAARIPAEPPTLPAPTGGFSAPTGLGVGPKGEIFVDNDGSTQVDKYGSNNLFTEEFPVAAGMYQMAVDDSTAAGDPSKGNIYVAVLGGSVAEYTPTGAEVRKIEGGGLVEPTAVAVDPRNGDVYVADFVHAEPGLGYVNKYDPEGKLIEKELITGLTKPEAMAVDSSGHIFVGSETPGHGVLEYDETGACMNACEAFAGVEAHTNGLAVGPEGNVYVGEENAGTILVFDSTGKTLLETFATGIANPFGIGVSGTTVYVTNGANAVYVFVPEALLSAKTEPATEVTKTTATLHAKVVLEGGGTVRYHFDYGSTTAYGVETPEEEVTVTALAPEVQVTAEIPPPPAPLLEPGTPYHYKIVATDTTPEVAEGKDETLKTQPPPPPAVGPATVSEVTRESATISTSVNPELRHTLYELNLGTSTAYGTPYPGDAGSGAAPVPLTFNLSGLEPGTTYHFRLTAANSDGTSSEADQTFTTAASPLGALPVFTVPLSPALLSFTGPAFPKESKTTTPKSLTRAQKLTAALKACKKKRSKSKRAGCVKQARKRYGPVKKK